MELEHPAEPALRDWSLVRAFLAVVDTGSLTQAARRLGSHQPTLSRQVAALEAQLGLPLFERTGRGLQPTAAAQALVEPCRRMAEAAETVERLGRRGRKADPAQPSGSLRLSCSEVVGHYLLPACLPELAERWPGIALDLVLSNSQSNLLRREADLALRLLRPQQSGLRARKLGDLALGLFASPGYLRRHGEPASLAALRQGHRLIGLDRDEALRRGLAAAGLRLEREAFALRSDSQALHVPLLQAGCGIGVLPLAVAARLAGLQRLLPELPPVRLPLWLVVHREIEGQPALRAVFDHLAERVPPLLRPEAQ